MMSIFVPQQDKHTITTALAPVGEVEYYNRCDVSQRQTVDATIGDLYQ